MAKREKEPTETTKLVPQQVTLSSVRTSFKRKVSLKGVCITSPAILQILAWTFVLGAVYEGAGITSHMFVKSLEEKRAVHMNAIVYIIMAVYVILAVNNMMYPVGGLIADVWCGRYRIVKTSLFLLLLSLTSMTVLAIVHVSSESAVATGIEMFFFSLSLVIVIPAFAGYTSNIVQLGFDQLHNEPSQSLGTFVHWLTWIQCVGVTVAHLMNTVIECNEGTRSIENSRNAVLYFCPSIFLIILLALLVISAFTRHLFYTERVHNNPYKLIINILNFARKNKCPVSAPSAFVYTYHRRPTRLDYAKEVYGGPFSNSDVDDVKTFLRVLLVLVALGPIHIISIASSGTLFPLFQLHFGNETKVDNTTCTARWVILESGFFSHLITVVFLPLYIWVIYGVMRNRVPKILTRLLISTFLVILSVSSLLVVDMIGHIKRHTSGENNTVCLFFQHRNKVDPLHMDWWIQIIPNLLLDISPTILLATALEFVSAQGPHTMKGVLVGLVFATKGFNQFIGAGLVYPFSLNQWIEIARESPIISCESGYLIVTLGLSLVGLICFIVSVCKYKYRVRGEEEFSQSDVEEVFERRIQQEQEFFKGLSSQELVEYEEQIRNNSINGPFSIN